MLRAQQHPGELVAGVKQLVQGRRQVRVGHPERAAIAHVANHRSVAKAGPTLGIYIQHDYEDEKRAALQRWSEQLAAIVQMPARIVPLKARKCGGA